MILVMIYNRGGSRTAATSKMERFVLYVVGGLCIILCNACLQVLTELSNSILLKNFIASWFLLSINLQVAAAIRSAATENWVKTTDIVTYKPDISFIKPACYYIRNSRSDKCVLSYYIVGVERKRCNTFYRWPQWSLWGNPFLEKKSFSCYQLVT